MTNVDGAAALGGPNRPMARSGRSRLPLVLLAIIAVVAVVLAGGAFAYTSSFNGKALPGTTVLGQDVSGKKPEEISALVEKRAKDVEVTVTADSADHAASLSDLGVSVDAAATAQSAVGQDHSFFSVLGSFWSGERAIQPVVSVDPAKVSAFAKGLVPEDRVQPQNAGVEFDEGEQAWKVTEGRAGQGVDPQALVKTVQQKAPQLKDFRVEQKISDIEPSITTDEAKQVVGSIDSILAQPMAIKGPKDKTYEVSTERRSSWISVEPNAAGDDLELKVDEQAVRDWVAKRADKASVKAQDGIEQVDASGKVVKVISQKTDGVEVTNTDAVADQLIRSMTDATPLDTAFESKAVAAKVTQAKAPEQPAAPKPGDPSAPAKPAPPAAPKPEPTGEKWIDVDLGKKTVTAYVGSTPVWGPRSIVDGKSGYETVTGTYEIYLRYDKQDMTNASRYPVGHEKYYYSQDVPWVQYFHRGYAFHGAPWRSSFGYSGSHGCINMRVSDAKWLYQWASKGTKVVVHR